MAYKVLDIYKDLPRTNCGDCDKGSCFAFASAVYLEGFPLSACPHLDPEAVAPMEAKLEAGRAQGEGRKPESSEQALRALLAKIAPADFHALAEACGASYLAGPPEALQVDFLGLPHRITRDDVVALGGEAPSVWVKIFLLIYATRAPGTRPAGEWASFRELPNTTSKSKSFEANTDRIGRTFEGKIADLDRAVAQAGGRAEAFGSADRAWAFRALPRVELLLLFWDRQEDFGARASLLVDRQILDYLDQEAIVFLAEAFANRLLGRSHTEVIP